MHLVTEVKSMVSDGLKFALGRDQIFNTIFVSGAVVAGCYCMYKIRDDKDLVQLEASRTGVAEIIQANYLEARRTGVIQANHLVGAIRVWRVNSFGLRR